MGPNIALLVSYSVMFWWYYNETNYDLIVLIALVWGILMGLQINRILIGLSKRKVKEEKAKETYATIKQDNDDNSLDIRID